MRQKILAGNWKMNTEFDSGLSLFEDIVKKLRELNFNPSDAQVVVAPPYIYLREFLSLAAQSRIELAVQSIGRGFDDDLIRCAGEFNLSESTTSLFSTLLVGHSEMRKYYGETSETLSKKIVSAMEYGKKVIYCIGETLEEREKGCYFDVLKNQIEEVVFSVNNLNINNLIIAYEPIWAIGTGRVAGAEQAQEVHAFVRQVVASRFGEDSAHQMTLLYGGSCNRKNAADLFAQPDIDGGLIGGASLDAEHFIDLYKILTSIG